MTPIQLILACAPHVAPITLAAIVQQESAGFVLAIHDNTSGRTYHPADLHAAVALARRLIAAHHAVDLGLAQIDSNNLPALHLGVQAIFDPCTNLRTAQTILLAGWPQSGGDLRAALSSYNTGAATSLAGARYSARVYAQAGVSIPAIPGGKLAPWALAGTWPAGAAQGAPLLPFRPPITWTPQASPLTPAEQGLDVHWPTAPSPSPQS
ncbi:lytic transglycosylase domain-containing protein [Thiomonas sp. X19]|uniref:lytic transglycosylase domain-containing protein n=1 Tax=Thiomonas sp. X19 TaxID=1050370 RepID=UPI000DD72314|nr:lytic transglycosylase domain-containing protein [Thiomonas sp. X19]